MNESEVYRVQHPLAIAKIKPGYVIPEFSTGDLVDIEVENDGDAYAYVARNRTTGKTHLGRMRKKVFWRTFRVHLSNRKANKYYHGVA